MAGNEAHIIERMLDSCAPFIDYWIAQCNGQDETRNIIQHFFENKNIPGFCYQTDWHYPGFNSDHLIQKCSEANHGCDWFLRVDADELLVVKPDFDWSILENTHVHSWDVVAKNDSTSWCRNRLWNTKLPWRFKNDKRHECIILPGHGDSGEEFQRERLDPNFYHYITSAGKSYQNPAKFASDALEIENQQIMEGTLTKDLYHFFYIAKSYYDAFTVGEFPLGIDHKKEFARRSIFYFTEYEKLMQATPTHEFVYFARLCLGEAFCFCGQFDEAEKAFLSCESCFIPRNEHIFKLALLYKDLNKFDKMLEQTTRLVDQNRKNPFPTFSFLVNSNLYCDTGNIGLNLHAEALKLVGKDIL